MLVEVIDESYVPSEDEVSEAADWLGIDVEEDADLLWIARDFLKAPMPAPWVPYEAEGPGEVFYFNPQTGESTWDHPCDAVFRQRYSSEKIKKAPVRVVTLSFTIYADDSDVKATCTSMSGDCLATFYCDPSQTFGNVKAMLAEDLQFDASRLRFALRSAVLPDDYDSLAVHLI